MKNVIAKVLSLLAASAYVNCYSSDVIKKNVEVSSLSNQNILAEDVRLDEYANWVMHNRSVTRMNIICNSFFELVPENQRRTLVDEREKWELLFGELKLTMGELVTAKYFFKALHGDKSWRGEVYNPSNTSRQTFVNLYCSIIACVIISIKLSEDIVGRINGDFSRKLGMNILVIKYVEEIIFQILYENDKLMPPLEYYNSELAKIKAILSSLGVKLPQLEQAISK
ncbi:hypothetical protein FACS1894122_06360 [Alphaproteobacteria bacterium]|nr:hypothetical protein FACS1894122_06360 [Alphaproteobacteria bacterium]